jgi:energy-coupling factor transporter transmembrane protein EcfT
VLDLIYKKYRGRIFLSLLLLFVAAFIYGLIARGIVPFVVIAILFILHFTGMTIYDINIKFKKLLEGHDHKDLFPQ